jgi:uncharacterized damage-inducible protein DinB
MREGPDDALLEAARLILDDSFAALDGCLDAPAEALNWHPAAPESNSLAGIAMHALSSARAWLLVVRGTPQTDRQRGSEFEAGVTDAAAFRAKATELMEECISLLESMPRPFDAAVMRRSHARRDPSLPHEMTAAWALLHVVDHLREHVGQMMLTRSLWEARSA